MGTSLSDKILARRERQRQKPHRSPADCPHIYGGYRYSVSVNTTQKCCKVCHTVLEESPRCRALVDGGRQCLSAARPDLDSLCTSHGLLSKTPPRRVQES